MRSENSGSWARASERYLPGILSGANALLTGFAVFFMPIHFKEALNFSGAEIGMVFAGYGLTALFVVIPSGLGTDAVTPKRLLIAALPLAFAAASLLALARTFLLVLGSVLAAGVASHLVKVASESFLYKTHDAARTGHTFGLYQVLRMTGYCTAMIGGSYLVTAFGFSATVFILAWVLLLIGLGALALPNVPVRWFGFSRYVGDLRRAEVLAFVSWLFLFASHWGAETTSYALFLRENLQLSFVEIGWYMTGEFLTFMVANYTAGRLYDRGADLGRLLRFGVVLAGIGHIGMTWPSLAPSVSFRLLHGVGDGCANLVMYVGVARLFIRDRVGGNLGFVTFVTMAGQFLGALVFGPLGERSGYEVPFLVSGVILMALGLFPMAPRSAIAPGAGSGLAAR